MTLQNLKEQMVYASVEPTHDNSQEDPNKRAFNEKSQEKTAIEAFGDDKKVQMVRENFGLFQPSIISPDYSLMNKTNESIDEKLLTQLTIQALAEKMPELVADNEKKEKVASIFKPVETSHFPKQEEQKSVEGNPINLFAGINANQLSAMLAENLMGLLNNAMLHINTSLSKSLPQVAQVPLLSQQNLANIQSIQEQRSQPQPQREEVEITDETNEPRNPVISPFRKPQLNLNHKGIPESEERKEEPSFHHRTTLETRADTRVDTKDGRDHNLSLTESLAREEREIQMEQALLRQQKAFGVRSTGHSAADMEDFLQKSFYFMNHEPQPIANLSEYYKELQSELSSSGEYNRQSIGLDSVRNQFSTRIRHRDSVSQKSEGQVFPPFDTNGDEEDLPKFGRRPSSRGGYSDIGSDIETPGKSISFCS